jgi:phosphotransferase system IIA component
MEGALPGGTEMHSCYQSISQRCGGAHTTNGEEGTIASGTAAMALVEQEEWVHEGERKRSTSDLAYVIHRNAEEFLEIRSKPAGGPNSPRKRWQKPPCDWLKVNSDGAFSAALGKGGWGFVIRDEEGDVVAAGAGALKHVHEAFHTEVLACYQGAMAVADKGIDKIILETDSLMLKQAMESDDYRFAEAGDYIYQLESLISGSFSNWLCMFVPRSCNKVAHALAAEGSSCNNGDFFGTSHHLVYLNWLPVIWLSH